MVNIFTNQKYSQSLEYGVMMCFDNGVVDYSTLDKNSHGFIFIYIYIYKKYIRYSKNKKQSFSTF